MAGIEGARKAAAAARAWYERRETVSSLKEISLSVREWLRANRQRTNRRGDKTDGAWLPLAKAGPAKGPEHLDIRRSQARQLLYGHGLRRLLNEMIYRDLLDAGAYARIPEFTSFACMALHEQLVGFRLAGIDRGLSLEDLKERFELAAGYNATKLRDRVVLPMAAAGLLCVSIDRESRYDIRLGRAAEIFHMEIFSPIRAEIEPRLGGETRLNVESRLNGAANATLAD